MGFANTLLHTWALPKDKIYVHMGIPTYILKLLHYNGKFKTTTKQLQEWVFLLTNDLSFTVCIFAYMYIVAMLSQNKKVY